MSLKAKNDLRHYAGAAGIFILIILLLLFLRYELILSPYPLKSVLILTKSKIILEQLFTLLVSNYYANCDKPICYVCSHPSRD